MMNFNDYAAKVANDARLSDLITRYDADTESLSDDELIELVNRSARIADEDEGIDPDEDEYPETDFYEDWDNLEMGFDPYMGCYSDDC